MSETPAQFTDMLPREPIDRIVNPLIRFLHIETASGFVLLRAWLPVPAASARTFNGQSAPEHGR